MDTIKKIRNLTQSKGGEQESTVKWKYYNNPKPQKEKRKRKYNKNPELKKEYKKKENQRKKANSNVKTFQKHIRQGPYSI